MMAKTSIEWADFTFNPWRGCSKVSAGCDHCYAEKMSHRNPAVLGEWGDQGTRVIAAESYWHQPLKWDRDAAKAGERRRVFCASLADVFEDRKGPLHDSCGNRLHKGEGFVGGTDISRHWYSESPCDEFPRPWLTLGDVRGRLFGLIHDTPNLDWLLLTKRPQNIVDMIADSLVGCGLQWPWKNVWLGTSVEDQATADLRVPQLLRVPAAVRFLSAEPLLGPINLDANRMGVRPWHDEPWLGVDWVIVGGESGPKARPMHPDWARSIRDQCQAAGVPFHFKQWGEHAPWDAERDAGQSGGLWVSRSGESFPKTDSLTQPGYCLLRRANKQAAGRLLDGREWNEFPEVAPHA
jgi:protein gp37